MTLVTSAPSTRVKTTYRSIAEVRRIITGGNMLFVFCLLLVLFLVALLGYGLGFVADTFGPPVPTREQRTTDKLCSRQSTTDVDKFDFG